MALWLEREERLPVVVSGLVLLVHTSGTRSGQQARGQMTRSDALTVAFL